MAEVASAYVSLIPSAKGFGSKIQSQIGGDVDRVGKSSGKRLGGGLASGVGSVAGKIFAPLAAAGAALAVGDFLKGSIAEARESQKVGALTTQVIKSTGGAAKVTASQVGDLAAAISNKTGIDDEAIQSASNLLLTFTNVRNEVGKGNDVFNQATQIATDMGAALGTEPKAAAIQLGKALNDPIKGVTALQRVGVSFTEQQKKTIKSLVTQGDTLGAQKIVLGELNKEFGGAAAASATAGEKASVAFGNLKEQIGTALLPVIDKFAGFFTEKIVPAISRFVVFVQKRVVPAVSAFIGRLKGASGPTSRFKELIGGIASFFRDKLVPAIRGLVSKVMPALKGLIASVTKTMKDHAGVIKFVGTIFKILGLVVTEIVLPLLGEIAKLLLKVLGPAFRAVVAVIDKVVIPAIKLIVKVFLGVVGAIIRGAAKAFGWIPGLGPKLKAAADKFDDFKNQVNSALDGTHSKKTITVLTPGAREANRQLADLLYKTQHLPKSVTIGVTNKLNNIPGRASGGPVRAGQPYIVGEHRPELFVPNTSGRILPEVPGGAGGQMRLHPHDIALLADAMAARPTVLDGRRVSQSMDRTLVMGVRP